MSKIITDGEWMHTTYCPPTSVNKIISEQVDRLYPGDELRI